MQYYAALEYAKTCVESEKGLHIVFTCPDTALPYVDEYDHFLLEQAE
jgi:hypothetical protein